MSIIGTLPVTLANGTTADATQVMNDLNYIVSQVNAGAAALAGGNAFTGTQTIGGDTICTLLAAQTLTSKTITFAAGTAAAPSLGFAGATTTGLYSPAANILGLVANGVEAGRLVANGNLLVGTTTDSGARVSIAPVGSTAAALALTGGTTAAGFPDLYINRTGVTESGTIGLGAGIQFSNSTNATGFTIQHYSSNLQFLTLNSAVWNERARIDSAGNFLIGTISVSVIANGGIINAVSNGGTGISQITVGHPAAATNGSGFMAFTFNAVVAGSVTQNGTTGVNYISNGAMNVTAAGALAVTTTSGTATFGTAGGSLVVDTAGRVYGTALHNNASAPTGTTNYIASGTYTPTLTATANVTAATAQQAQWMRVGNVVTVSGTITAITTTTAAAQSSLSLTLPLASTLGTYGLAGSGAALTSGGAPQSYGVQANPDGSNRAGLTWGGMNTTTASLTYTYTYTVA